MIEGIVKDVAGRKSIIFNEDPGEFLLYGVKISSRKYNNKYLCSVGQLDDALFIGDIISKDGDYVNVKNNAKLAHVDLSEVVSLLKEVKGLCMETIDLIKKTREVVVDEPKIQVSPAAVNVDRSGYEEVGVGYRYNGTVTEAVYSDKNGRYMRDYFFSDGTVALKEGDKFIDRHSKMCHDLAMIKEQFGTVSGYGGYIEEIAEMEREWDRKGIKYGERFSGKYTGPELRYAEISGEVA